MSVNTCCACEHVFRYAGGQSGGLTNGYGMHYRENFVHHSLEVPGLHGRGGVYFDDHLGSVSNCSGKCCYFLDLWAFSCSISHVPTRVTRLNRESITL